MDLNKLSTADRVIGASAIVFLISTFLPWWGKDFGAEFGVSVGTYTQNGWDYFLTGLIPLLLVVAMVVVIVLDRFTTTQLPTAPLPWGQVHLIAGATVAVLVVLRLIIPSNDVPGPVDVDLDRMYGLFIAAIAAIGVGVGGFLKSKEPEDAYSGGPAAYPGTQPPPPPPGGASF
jgi:hypothetical protein